MPGSTPEQLVQLGTTAVRNAIAAESSDIHAAVTLYGEALAHFRGALPGLRITNAGLAAALDAKIPEYDARMRQLMPLDPSYRAAATAPARPTVGPAGGGSAPAPAPSGGRSSSGRGGGGGGRKDDEYVNGTPQQVADSADAVVDHAMRCETAGDFEDALQLYTDAVATYVKVMKDPRTLTALRDAVTRRADLAATRAEKIKNRGKSSMGMPMVPTYDPLGGGSGADGGGSGGGGGGTGVPDMMGINPYDGVDPYAAVKPEPKPAPAPAPPTPSEPASDGSEPRLLTEAEKSVIRRTSTVNGRLFTPWTPSDGHEQFTFPTPFEDKDGGILPLSELQQSRLAAWKRPSEFMTGEPVMVRSVTPYTITQELVGDCSFVSSLIIAAEYERRRKKRLITSIVYPQTISGEPRYNASGKYVVRLYYNGIPRRVEVDDRLPVDADGKLFCSFSTAPNELWVSILEKAYMKLHGGYDFPGSNSGIDLFCLTGWIPETVNVGVKGFNKMHTWRKMVGGCHDGNVLITAATGPMTSEQETATGLVETHAYAVLDAREAEGHKMVMMKNPWARTSWKGRWSASDSSSWTHGMQRALNFNPEASLKADNGIFWIEYEDMLSHFKGVLFNWDPELFKFKHVRHACWPVQYGPKIDAYNVGENPQFSLTFEGAGLVWVVLTRHIVDKQGKEKTIGDRDPSAGVGHAEGKGDEASAVATAGEGPGGVVVNPDEDYLAMHVFQGGQRVYVPVNALRRGKYSNGEHSLQMLSTPAGRSRFTLVLSQYSKHRSIDYTLRVYSRVPVFLGKAERKAGHEAKAVVGEWDRFSAMGNSGTGAAFFNNPQYRMTLPSAGHVTLRLLANKEFPTNIRVYATGGTRVASFIEEKLSSGDYRHGMSVAETDAPLAAGAYTVVVSTFKAGQAGKFKLIAAGEHEAPTMQRINADGTVDGDAGGGGGGGGGGVPTGAGAGAGAGTGGAAEEEPVAGISLDEPRASDLPIVPGDASAGPATAVPVVPVVPPSDAPSAPPAGGSDAPGFL